MRNSWFSAQGSPDLVAFIQTFRQEHYNPQALIATGGPDQADAFIKAVGSQSAEGVFVPLKWYPGAETYQNADFVQAYLAKYGGRSAISARTRQGHSPPAR